jgi:hypothetical protein
MDEALTIPGPDQRGEVAVRIFRCRLADEMLLRLNGTESGQRVAAIISVSTAGTDARSMYGPDMSPPDRLSCYDHRQAQDCEPAFVRLLGLYALDVKVPAP